MAVCNTVTERRRDTSALLLTCAAALGAAAALTAGSAPAETAPDQIAPDQIAIVRRYEKLGDAKFDFAPARPGPITCYVYDRNGITLGRELGYVQTGSIRFYGIPLADVAHVECERQD